MNEKKKLAVGDRVRVFFGNKTFVREIERIEPGTGILEMSEPWQYYSITCQGASPKQCRRLKPKPKPKPEKKEARRVWIETIGEGAMSALSHRLENKIKFHWEKDKDGYAEFVEVLPGSVQVTRESLAEAIKKADKAMGFISSKGAGEWAGHFSIAIGLGES